MQLELTVMSMAAFHKLGSDNAHLQTRDTLAFRVGVCLVGNLLDAIWSIAPICKASAPHLRLC